MISTRSLTARGHQFVRYADDIMIYVKSERAGERVMASTKTFVEKRLKLRVNEAKSAVAPATSRPFLGFGFYLKDGEVKVRLDPKAKQAAKARIRRLTARQLEGLDGGANRPPSTALRAVGRAISL